MGEISLEVRYTGSDFDRCNKSLCLHQESIAKSDQTHSKQNKKYFLRNPSVALNFIFQSQSQWGTRPFLVEWPLDALELQNKNEDIVHNERKRLVLVFTGFAQLLTPGWVIDLRLTKITKFCLEEHIEKFYFACVDVALFRWMDYIW